MDLSRCGTEDLDVMFVIPGLGCRLGMTEQALELELAKTPGLGQRPDSLAETGKSQARNPCPITESGNLV